MLTDLACKSTIKQAIQVGKPIKKSDHKGLYLHAQPSGSAHWRYKYRIWEKEKLLALGSYPEISLSEARERHLAARKLVEQNKDPSMLRQQSKRLAKFDARNTFETIAREWHSRNLERWSDNHAGTILRRLENDLFGSIGNLPIKEITPPVLFEAVKRIENRKAHEMARRSLQIAGKILRFAVATGRLDRDFSADLKGQLRPYKRGHFAAIDIDDLPKFLEVFDKNEARLYPQTRYAMELLMLTLVRTSELIEAKWNEFDLPSATWTIPAERMKMKRTHIVPLSRQAVSILETIAKENGAKSYFQKSDYIFPSQKGPNKHMSNNTILKALALMGYKHIHTGHGFRALGMGIAKEKLGYRHEIPDLQLAHVPAKDVDRAYDRAKFLGERTIMMQRLADYIERVRKQNRLLSGNSDI